ncbi:hypothetical protein [Faecalicatena contorta]|uniref:hypothetical protein n=1 Tax=Faecalicatena contorta TaxID=39482 RepID=UPI001F485F97|nr:hypothetical protein [Faecalicatena contorta]MCF2667980.1 hypothetical protein [Faecalicatena contorta]
MKKRYGKPLMHCEEFVPNQFIAGCDLNIVSGTDTVKIYCAKTSYVTVFTSAIGCAYQRAAFTSTSEAEKFFSQLFQWGDGVAEGGNVTNNTTSLGWTSTQKNAANAEIDNGRPLYSGTVDLGGYSSSGHGSRVHAGYALDYLNGFEEGKALS